MGEANGIEPCSQLPGLYVHVPFCRKKCIYCDFASTTQLGRMTEYVEAVLQEADSHSNLRPQWDSLYLGGGTASLLPIPLLERLLSGLLRRFSFLSDSEITMEANPCDVSVDLLRASGELGVNRIIVGVQSFQNPLLEFLGRRHDGITGFNALKLAREAGVKQLGLDLIFGVPGQDLNQWREDLDRALEFQPEHISCYQLTYEPGTRLHVLKEKERLTPIGESEAFSFFWETGERLARAGYEQYEVSNFAREAQFRSRHNEKYWSHVPYLGLGPSAHSFDGRSRRWNYRNLNRYLDRLSSGESPVEGSEILDREALRLERLFFGFRTRFGLRPETLKPGPETLVAGKDEQLLNRLTNDGFLVRTETGYRSSRRGLAVADALTAMFA
ncbi:MAG: radical SAM family heme chaperone HemW [Deltaproteobacteria bacterium]|nr:radical SAM family heme chaperone HemW [Deltaproteobacteria bacterium]